MSEKQTEIPKHIRKPLWKRLFRGFLWTMFVLVVLGILGYHFWLKPELISRISSKVQKNSYGKYRLEIHDIQLGAFPLSVTVKQAKLSQDSAVWDALPPEVSDTLPSRVALEVPALSISDISLLRFLRTDSLRFQELVLSEPNIQLFVDSEKKKKVPVLQTIRKLLYKLSPELEVARVAMEGGRLRWETSGPKGLVTQEFDHVDVSVLGVTLNEKVYQGYEQNEFSEELVVDIQGICVTPPDRGSMELDKFHVSSLDSTLLFQGISYQDAEFVDLKIPEVKISDIGIHQYLGTRSLRVGEVFLEGLSAKMAKVQNPDKFQEVVNLKEALPRIVHKFSEDFYVERIFVKDANVSFDGIDVFDRTLNKNVITNASIELRGFSVDSSSLEKEGRVLYSDHLHVKVDDFTSVKVDSSLIIDLGGAEVFSEDTALTLRGVKIHRRGQFNANLPLLQFQQIHWREYWENKTTTIDKLVIRDPQINFITGDSLHPKVVPQRPFADVLLSLTRRISIKKTEIKNASLEHVHRGPGKVGSQSFSGFSASFLPIQFGASELRNRPLDSLVSLIQKFSLKNYKFKSKDGKISISAKRVKAKNHYQNVVVNGVLFFNGQDLRSSFEHVKLNQVDWGKLWYQRKLFIDSINVLSPMTYVYRERDTTTLTNQKDFSLRTLLPELTSKAFEELRVRKIVLNDGMIQFAEGDEDQVKSFHFANGIDLTCDDFHVLSDSDLDTSRVFFSERLSLDVGHYEVKSLQSGVFFGVDGVHIPGTDSSLFLSGLDLRKEGQFDIHIPSIHVKDPTWEIFWHRQALMVPRVQLESPLVQLLDREQQAVSGFSGVDEAEIKKVLGQKLKPVFNMLSIGKIQAMGGRVVLPSKAFADTIGSFDVSIDRFRYSDRRAGSKKNFLFAQSLSFSWLKPVELPLDSSWQVHWEAISGELKNGSVTLGGLALLKDSTDVLRIPAIELEGVQFREFLKNGDLNMDRFVVDRPQVTLTNSLFANGQDSTDRKVQLKDIPFLSSVSISQLALSHAKLGYTHHKAIGTDVQQIRDFSVVLEDFTMDSTTNLAGSHPFDVQDTRFQILGYSYKPADSLYAVSIESIVGNQREEQLFVSDFHLNQMMTEKRYMNSRDFGLPRYDLIAESVNLQGVDFDQLIDQQDLEVRAIKLKGVNLSVSEDTRLPRPPDFEPPMPHELIANLPLKVTVDTIFASQMEIDYTGKSQLVDSSGKITFDSTSLQLTHLSNTGVFDTCLVRGLGKFMSQGKLEIWMKMPLNVDSASFSYRGHLGPMEAYHINRMIVPNARISVEKGFINSIDFEADVVGAVTNGEMLARFQDFDVKILGGKDDPEENRWFVSSLANMILPNRNDRKLGIIFYQSNPKDGFIKLLWLGIQSGLKDTLLPALLK